MLKSNCCRLFGDRAGDLLARFAWRRTFRTVLMGRSLKRQRRRRRNPGSSPSLTLQAPLSIDPYRSSASPSLTLQAPLNIVSLAIRTGIRPLVILDLATGRRRRRHWDGRSLPTSRGHVSGFSKLFAGGGDFESGRFQRLEAIGVKGVLVAFALHDRRLRLRAEDRNLFPPFIAGRLAEAFFHFHANRFREKAMPFLQFIPQSSTQVLGQQFRRSVFDRQQHTIFVGKHPLLFAVGKADALFALLNQDQLARIGTSML